MLNASVYLINCCWHEFQVFCGSNHLWAYHHVDSSCVMTSLNNIFFWLNANFFCFSDNLLLEPIMYETIIIFMSVMWWRYQKETISVFLTLSWRKSLSYSNQSIFFSRANQWTDFYMIGTFGMKVKCRPLLSISWTESST